ncbi:urease accessory protein UreF [Bifidobacterium oedipodis]|uniref:Urease accessory protein UreF n=1 Tax=Bifidobacterium oedipodis TaxID=2675322 RepID=A0A7Y0HS52_9BIFI|nr:urease accessory UreF family protein [Bifidobacterium sp. DSM 109957]NMM94785.1 urease accessory protein UreF [Bifidobacterium sp. DSM 109957]
MASMFSSDDVTELQRLNYLQVCDSVFPVGAFALSNGMETFVQRDIIRSNEDFARYVENYLEVAAYKEIGYMVLAGRLASDKRLSADGFARKLAELDELCAALTAPREIREGQNKMCMRFIKLVDQMEEHPLQPADSRHLAGHMAAGSTPAKPSTGSTATSTATMPIAPCTPTPIKSANRTVPHLDAYKELIDANQAFGMHAIAMGLFAADKAPSLREAAITYCYSLISALTVCAVKAVPVSQYAGQIAVRNSFPDMVAAVDLAFTLKPDDLGISGAYLDIAAMQHETLYSRLYMS